jgi:hypothetical protein
LAGLRCRERAEPISGAHRKLSASTTICAIAERPDNAATIAKQRDC